MTDSIGRFAIADASLEEKLSLFVLVEWATTTPKFEAGAFTHCWTLATPAAFSVTAYEPFAAGASDPSAVVSRSFAPLAPLVCQALPPLETDQVAPVSVHARLRAKIG